MKRQNGFLRGGIALGLLFVSAALSAQGPSMQASAKTEGPTLAETIAFMNKSVAPEDSYVSTPNHCEVYVTRNRLYRFAIPAGLTTTTDPSGVAHSKIRWMIVKEPAQIVRFNLEFIDPTSINSRPVPSIEFLKSHNLDDHPSEREETDLTLVSFQTADEMKSIETGYLNISNDGKNVSPVFDRRVSMGIIVFESKDRAERFVTAFVHAVNLCGGKASEFPPTPSKP
jgi:hypothetical protein